MLGLKLNHVSKIGHRLYEISQLDALADIETRCINVLHMCYVGTCYQHTVTRLFVFGSYSEYNAFICNFSHTKWEVSVVILAFAIVVFIIGNFYVLPIYF